MFWSYFLFAASPAIGSEPLPVELCDQIDMAKIIFNHLQIFQYLKDLKEHDKRLISNYMPLSVTLDPRLKMTFLKDWDNDIEFGKGITQGWNLEGEYMDKVTFIRNFVGVSLPENYGEEGEKHDEPGLIPNMTVQ